MVRFITGDSLGNLKAASYNADKTCLVETLQGGVKSEPPVAIQKLAAAQINGSTMVAAGYADGFSSTYTLEDNTLHKTKTWSDSRFKPGKTFVGMALTENGTYTCSNNGALMLSSHDENEPSTSLLPNRLCAWRLAKGEESFAYGGDEVDVSVWDTKRAFQSQPPSASDSKKRRRDELFPAEVWRAKNVPNDGLSLRQPVRVTCLTHSSHSASSIFAGTQLGHLRRYDTRAARKPVADWKNILRNGKGVETVEAGFSEHEVFVSDSGNTMGAVDCRNGRVLYRYEGISGAVLSIAPSPEMVASVSLDRYIRFHSAAPPPAEPGLNLEKRGKVLGKAYAVGSPTVIVWDQEASATDALAASKDTEEDEIWQNMQDANDDDGEDDSRRRKTLRTT